MKRWEKMRAQIKPEFKAEVSEDKTVLYLSGDVVSNEYGWHEDDITPKKVNKALNESKGEVLIKLNSGGGDCFAGVEIYNLLKDYPGKVIVEITGLSASAASILSMGADEIIMRTGSMMMVHRASTIVWGNKNALLKAADMMDKVDSSIVDIYAERIGLEKQFITDLLDEETWMTAEEAVKDGFADRTKEIVNEDEIDIAAKINNSVWTQELMDAMNDLEIRLANKVTEVIENKIFSTDKNAQKNEGSISVPKNKLKFMKEGK
ncbi:head maturation protease, ClpP-related [Facklamia sp. P13069]|uniref:head maturation protease, ClpP-related n=1 Tax=Facklamia sp. P13069 TaxID=3421954 RepID=UPI003D16622C